MAEFCQLHGHNEADRPRADDADMVRTVINALRAFDQHPLPTAHRLDIAVCKTATTFGNRKGSLLLRNQKG